MKLIKMYRVMPVLKSEFEGMTADDVQNTLYNDPEIRIEEKRNNDFCKTMRDTANEISVQKVSIDSESRFKIAKLLGKVYHLEDNIDDIRARMDLEIQGDQVLVSYDDCEMMLDANTYGEQVIYSEKVVRMKVVFAQVIDIKTDDVKAKAMLARNPSQGGYVETEEDIKYLQRTTHFSDEFLKRWKHNCILSIEEFKDF